MRLVVGREKAARIADRRLTLAAGENAGSNLALLDGEVAGQANCAGSLVGCESCSIFCEAIHARVALFAGHGKKAGIFRLAVCQREGGLDRAAKRVSVGTIGGG